MTMDEITISRAEFDRIAMDAFAEAGKTTIERMIELADNEAEARVVRKLGDRCLAEIGEAL